MFGGIWHFPAPQHSLAQIGAYKSSLLRRSRPLKQHLEEAVLLLGGEG